MDSTAVRWGGATSIQHLERTEGGVGVRVEASRWPAGVLRLAGLGVDPPADLTLGTLGWLAGARRVLTLEPPQCYEPALDALGLPIENLQPLFDAHPLRHDALREAAHRAVEAAAAEGGVLFLLGGHATLAAAPATYAREESARRGVALEVRASIGSLDQLLADLVLDPTDVGIQVLRGGAAAHLGPKMPAAILCPGYAESIRRAPRLGAIARLIGQLRAVYGSEARFCVYSRLGHVITVSERGLSGILADLGTRQRLAEVLLFGPVHMLPDAVRERWRARPADPGGDERD